MFDMALVVMAAIAVIGLLYFTNEVRNGYSPSAAVIWWLASMVLLIFSVLTFLGKHLIVSWG